MDKKISVAFIIVVSVFSVFLLRLWYLQIIKGDEYKRIDERNRIRVIDIPAPRGIIYDRNNNALVKNVLSYDISMVREDMPREQNALAELGGLIGLSAEDILKLAKSSRSPYETVKLRRNVSFEEVARIEARKTDFPGLLVEVTSARGYLYGQTASHLLGYLSNPTPKQLSLPEFSNVPKQAFVGQFGIEKSYDSILRGVAGKKIVEVDALGNIIRFVRIQKPLKGKDIRISMDINAQLEAERSLQGKTGAVVALKADTGEVLAMASSPSFDPNLFVAGIEKDEWRALIRDPYKPLMNRAIQNQYPPGSTFKTITALSALETGMVSQKTTAYCSGSTYFGRTFRCWKEGGHGSVDTHRAIVESCDVYFYDIGKKINIDTIAKYAWAFGLGRPTGINLESEAPGNLPSSKWKLKVKKEKWYQGETLSVAIGQGYLTVTPIQMARLTAGLVNGGRIFKPHLLADESPELERTIDVNKGNLDFIKRAMLGVVYESGGTGGRARSKVVSIGGKTGTAQVIGGAIRGVELADQHQDHAWFIAYAPQLNSQVAAAVFVEHGGHGGSAAAPIAKQVIEAYFNPPKPESEEGEQGDASGEVPAQAIAEPNQIEVNQVNPAEDTTSQENREMEGD
ncbi:MAG: penicillin-binding protein 2 [Nitrospiraceae bacterium]|nr:MAG: penicillin-binding protein 2 [Nitrospiraceae bacterium]